MALKTDVRSLVRSQELYSRAREIILGGGQTISKQPERYDRQRFPAFFDHASGCRAVDLDGNEYVDFIMALGAIVLGYCWPTVDDAVRRQLEKGTLFSSNSPLEVELAEKLLHLLPNAECVRFFKTGAESTSAAVRMARAFTGRNKVITSGYHGWHDWWVAKRREPGIPESLYSYTLDLPYGDIPRARELFEDHGKDVACLILEPIVLDFDKRFVLEVCALAKASGALVVFDEIITGFRTGLGGIQQYLEIEADLATYGKAIANGFPLAVLAGRKEIFESARRLWISTTFGGETLSLAAALATLDELERPATMQLLWSLGERLSTGWLALLSDRPHVAADVKGLGPLPVLQFRAGAKVQEDIFISRMLEQGYLTRRAHYWFVTASHTIADIDDVLEACDRAFEALPA